MKVYDCEVTFMVDAYADGLQRKAVLAVVADGEEKGEPYSDVTVNIPQYPLEEDECFLCADCPMLIEAMEHNGYLEIIREVNVNYGTYKVGRFTQKFVEEYA